MWLHPIQELHNLETDGQDVRFALPDEKVLPEQKKITEGLHILHVCNVRKADRTDGRIIVQSTRPIVGQDVIMNEGENYAYSLASDGRWYAL